jgi:hypothetical protein
VRDYSVGGIEEHKGDEQVLDSACLTPLRFPCTPRSRSGGYLWASPPVAHHATNYHTDYVRLDSGLNRVGLRCHFRSSA